MAKAPTSLDDQTDASALDASAPDAPTPDAPDAFPLAIDEFCARLSVSDRRVELIGAFHAVEKAAGRIKDLESAFAERFAAFVNQPA